MGFSDRLRAWLKGDSKRSGDPTTATPSNEGTRELEEFADSRQGVEAFLEPKTAIYSTTLLLVAADGEYLRRPVRDRKHASEFCRTRNLPMYDAARVGYPRRMHDYERGRAPRRIELSELPPWPGDDAEDEPGGEADGTPRG